MAEYIGSRISLISKRDIRYVGTLHEISSENSTVALEQVKSFGTEGRNPEDEVPASENVYEYIVFRGSDVKDLRIEKEPEKPAQPPQVPDDPAILGNARPIGHASSMPQPQNQQEQQHLAQPSLQNQQNQQQQQQHQQRFQQQASHPPGPPRFQQQQYFPPYYPPPTNQRYGLGGQQGFPPHGYPPMSYGSPPPGWYPPPGQGFPHPPPSQYYPPPMSFGAPGQPPIQQEPQARPSTPSEPPTDVAPKTISQQESSVDKLTATVKLPSANITPAPTAAQTGPSPPTESKPNISEALAPPAAICAAEAPAAAKSATSVPRSGRIVPAVPMLSPIIKPKVSVNGALQSTLTNVSATSQIPASSVPQNPTQVPTKSLEDANLDARAAVAAAMAKLPPAPGPKKRNNNEDSEMDNLTFKVNEMRTNDNIRSSKMPGTGGYAAGHRGGRGGYRGGRQREEPSTKKMEVPKTDYDFAEANAKFNKQEIVKSAAAIGSPVSSPVNGYDISAETSFNGGRQESEQSIILPCAPGYNKASSFFDNISSESKDRDDLAGKRLGGREFRSEEQKKNFETFGQGSVDNGYRGGLRGRSRGRGYRGGRGTHAPRGGRGTTRGRGPIAAES